MTHPRATLDILILGGTGMTGPHIVKAALDRGHRVTTFTRGRTPPTTNRDRFQEVEALVGDRAGDLTALEGRRWDVVIDNSGQRVEWTETTAEMFRDTAHLYVYTSSTGVYFPYRTGGIREDMELVRAVPDDATETQRGSYEYGVMKANSERAARRIFGEDRTLVLRPTYIVGPGDPTDRFTYWPVRLARGGEIFVPGRSTDPIQIIDARDIAAFLMEALDAGTVGTFNLAGPPSGLGMHAFVFGAHAAFNSPVDWVLAPDYDFLREQGIEYVIPWILPEGDHYGSARVDPSAALAAGLTFTPLAETVRDTEAWWREAQGAGLISPERVDRLEGERMAWEAEVIAAWRAWDPTAPK